MFELPFVGVEAAVGGRSGNGGNDCTGGATKDRSTTRAAVVLTPESFCAQNCSAAVGHVITPPNPFKVPPRGHTVHCC